MRAWLVWIGFIVAAVSAAQTAKPVPVMSFTDHASGMSLEYPSAWTRVKGPEDYCSSGVTLNGRDGSARPSFSVDFSGDGSSYANTSLASLNFAFGVKSGISAEGCQQIAAANGHAKRVVFHGVTYASGQESGCGGGHGLDEQVFTTMRGTTCYIFEEDFFTASPEGARDLTRAEMDALQRQLDAILQSVRWHMPAKP
jgi:hypothetical protein